MPTEDPKVFGFIISASPDEIQRAMQSHADFVEMVHTMTNRDDIKIGEIKWQTDWRYESPKK